jgi:hypothetical protein
MRKTRHPEEQIAFALNQAETGFGRGVDPPDGDFGADVLPLEEGLPASP